MTKVFNELLGQYYHDKFGVDFRSIRYPGVISSAKYAFNGTTDYSTGKYFEMFNIEFRNILPCSRDRRIQVLVAT